MPINPLNPSIYNILLYAYKPSNSSFSHFSYVVNFGKCREMVILRALEDWQREWTRLTNDADRQRDKQASVVRGLQLMAKPSAA